MSTEAPQTTPPAQMQYFGIRRLVLVNSGEFCYGEIPLNGHALLLGEGNRGKSSLMNSLRLFLLPENNFKKSRKKFAFRSSKSGQYYSNEESFDHYFPSSRSFLIMEVVNPAGTHCQILYRDQTSRLSYGRIFVPVPYEQLRGLFWQSEGDPDGIGYANTELSPSRVFEAVKRLSKETTFCSDPKRLESLLYNSDLLDTDASRFSVLPLSGNDTRKIQSLRTLIILLFEMKADDEAMANAVASIIEADKKYSSDELDLNIDEFFHRHEQLKEQQQAINRIEREKPRFEGLQRQWEHYNQLQEHEQQLVDFRKGLAQTLESVRSSLDQARTSRDSEKHTLDHTDTQIREVSDKRKEQNGSLKNYTNTLKTKQNVKTDGDLLVSRYPGKSIGEIREIISDDLTDQNKHLKALENETEAKNRLEEINRKLTQTDKELAEIRQRREGQQWQLHQQLEESVAGPLAAVNPRLLGASPGQALDQSTLDAIKAFSELLPPTESGYQWFDLTLDSQTFTQENLDQRQCALAEQRRELEREHAELADPNGTQHDRADAIKKVQQEINAAEKDLTTLKGYEGVDNAIEEAQRGIDEAQEAMNQADGRIEKLNTKRRERADALAAAETRVSYYASQEETLMNIERRLDTEQRRFPHLTNRTSDKPTPAHSITHEYYEGIMAGLDEMQQCRSRIVGDMRHFWSQGLLGESHNAIIEDNLDRAQLEATYADLRELFEGLTERRDVLSEQVKAHNETVASYQQALKANADHIHRFENQINRDLDGVTVNDLVQIRVDIHVNQRFQNLVEESEAIDPYAGELVSDAFYERLRVFVGDYFKGADNHLTMENVITGLSYRTRQSGSQDARHQGSVHVLNGADQSGDRLPPATPSSVPGLRDLSPHGA